MTNKNECHTKIGKDDSVHTKSRGNDITVKDKLSAQIRAIIAVAI